jgi:SAM-dependent methyltransferase
MTQNFSRPYVLAYDLLNEQKPYRAEVAFVVEQFRFFSWSNNGPNSVLDLGCGSGKHLAEFAPCVRKTGVDRSQAMISLAQERNIPNSTFVNSPIEEFRSKSSADLVILLFHVINYQVNELSLSRTFETIKYNLASSGVAVLDFWNREAWDRDPPVTRTTVRENDFYYVERTSRPEIDFKKNIVAIEIDLQVRHKMSTDPSQAHFFEKHYLRGFTVEELSINANACGLSICGSGPWFDSNRSLSKSDWLGWIALKHLA